MAMVQTDRIMNIGLKGIVLIGLIVSFGLQVSCKTQRKITALERKVSMPVFKAERLESVIMRLALNTGRRFDVSLLVRSDAMAKAADYWDVGVGVILQEQLKGTPFGYRLKKNELKIYKKDN
jgi:hypothetical protein